MTDVMHAGRKLDESGLEQLLAGLTAVRGGDFSTRLPETGDPLMDQIATVFNGMADQLDQFTSEVTRVAREVGSEGRLGGQADIKGVSGTWKDLTDSVNAMAGNLTGQVRDVAQVATAVAKGDLTQKITVDAKGEMLELKSTLNTMVDQLSGFADEVTRVAREVGSDGILGGQAHVPGVSGTWKDLTESVNVMAANLTAQVRSIAAVTTSVAKGDLTQKIRVDARGEILELKETINTMVDQLSSFAAEVTRVAREVGSEGRLGGQAEVEGVSGTWKRLTENVNELAGNLTRQVRAIAEVTSAVAAGDLTRSISVEAQGEVAELKDNINAMVQSLRETIQANQQQDWLKSNLARISGMMQGHRDLAVVAELIMDELAPLVGAQHGTFFLAEPENGDTRLRLIAGYGLRADKEAPLQYRLGQSLIGQVAKSKRSIIVADLPDGYVKITSGLGEASPSNLAVLPILFEGRVLGVIELAAFTTFTPVQTDFLEQLTESLGVNVNTIVANARTDALLNESQRLTGELQVRSVELQAQQEELQRSNAELEDKAELLARQNSDIETKNAEIERARQEIEERARQLALASKYKSQFLANMSHELRTPLNSLLILARLLAQNPGRNLTAKGPDVRGGGGRRSSRGDVHRPAAAAPGARQPAVQRGQVHRPRPCRAAGRPGRARAGRSPGRHVLRHRHRHRDRPGEPEHDLRGLPAGGRHAQPPLRRHRAGAVDRPRGRRAARRGHHGPQRAGPGQHVHPARAARAAGHPGSRGSRRAPRRRGPGAASCARPGKRAGRPADPPGVQRRVRPDRSARGRPGADRGPSGRGHRDAPVGAAPVRHPRS
jgi:HAMP domain-containing protein/GAF domain-containing protein